METSSTHVSAQQCFCSNCLQLGDLSAIYFKRPSFQAVSGGFLQALVALPCINRRYYIYSFISVLLFMGREVPIGNVNTESQTGEGWKGPLETV